MPVKWTSENDQRLLLLIVRNHKFDAAKIAADWGQQYSSEESKPTPRAISEHLVALGKRTVARKPILNRNAAVAKAATPTTPKSARSTGVKALGSAAGSKRKKCTMSEEDDESMGGSEDESDADKQVLVKDVGHRASIGRASKTAKKYNEPDSEESQHEVFQESQDEFTVLDCITEGKAQSGAILPSGATDSGHENGDGTHQVPDFAEKLEQAGIRRPKKKICGTTDDEWDSEVSSFSASFH